MINRKIRAKSKVSLEWDFCAEPTWVKGVNVPINEVVKDKKRIKEIEKWYMKFSRAEEILHYKDINKKITKNQLENTIKHMKERLVPHGQKIATDIGATFNVDWGHDSQVKKLVSKILGRNKLT